MSDHEGFFARCLELEKKVEKLRAALLMARSCIPPGMKPELQQIDEALKD